MDDESDDGSATEPISLVDAPVAEPAAEPKTQWLAGRAHPLLLRVLFRGDPSSQLAARSASQLAGRSAHLHHGETRTLVPELRGHCEPVVGPFGHVASGASQSGGVRLLQKKKGPRASIGFRTRDALAAASSCGGPGGGIGGVGTGGSGGGGGGGGGPLPPCTASLRLGSEWSFCCHLRLPLPEPPPTVAERRRVRSLAMGLTREGCVVRCVLHSQSAVLLVPQLTSLLGLTMQAPGCPTHSGRTVEPPRAQWEAAVWQ